MNMSDRQITFLRNRVKAAMRQKEDHLHSRWDMIINEYRCSPNRVAEVMSSLSQAGEYASWDDSLIPALEIGQTPYLPIIIRKWVALLTLRNPYFIIEAQKPEDDAISWILEKSIDNHMSSFDMRQTRNGILYYSGLFGTGIVKNGYASEFVYDEEAWAGNIPAEAEEYADPEKLLPYGITTEATSVVKPGKPASILVHPKDIFFDPDARVLHEVSQIYHRSWRPLCDVLHDERYDKEARAEVRACVPTETERDTYNAGEDLDNDLDQSMRRTEIVEVFDVRSRQYCVMSMEGESRMLREWTRFPLDIENPYRFFQPIPDPASPWGIPYALTLLGPCRAQNALRAKMVESVNRGGKRIILMDSASSDQNDIDRVCGARDQSIVAYNFGGKDPSMLTTVLDFPSVSPELMRLQSMVESDINFISGLDDPSLNQYKSDVTATEAHIRHQQQSVGIDDIRVRYEDFLEAWAADQCRIILSKWDQTEVVKITGTNPRVFAWAEIERERVLRDFTLKVHAGSTQKLDQATYRRQMTDLLPRIVDLKKQIDMDMQMGNKSPVSAEAIFEAFMEEFDPRLAERILQRKDPVSIVQRLLQQGVRVDMSPDLMQELMRRQNPQMPQGMGQPQPPAQGQPGGLQKPQTIMTGLPRQDMMSGQTGRMLSEANG